MFRLALVGIGAGSPEFLTRAAEGALNSSDLILIPRKGEEKGELAELRRMICAEVLTNPETKIVEFDVPVRRAVNGDYLDTVDDWHEAVAKAWSAAIAQSGGMALARVALLIWGDPSLYDSSLRIAARLDPAPEVDVIPGITAVQALCAAHRIPLNEIGEPFIVTTGRQLRAGGWPEGVDTVAVMLDGACAFQTLDAADIQIWWGAYLGMSGEVLVAGPLAEVGSQILEMRNGARAKRGWIMDTYILKRMKSRGEDMGRRA